MMSSLTAKDVKLLRENTGAGYMDCKKALSESGGNPEQATVLLRQRGISVAKKKSARITAEGVVESYIHTGGKVGVLLEVNCETDFAATTQVFRVFTKNLAMHIASFAEDVSNNGANQIDCLLNQKYYQDETIRVKDVVNACIARIEENIKIKRFIRYDIGELDHE